MGNKSYMTKKFNCSPRVAKNIAEKNNGSNHVSLLPQEPKESKSYCCNYEPIKWYVNPITVMKILPVVYQIEVEDINIWQNTRD